MDVACPAQETCQGRISLSPEKNSKQLNHDNDSEHMHIGSVEAMLAGSDSVDHAQLRPSPENAQNVESDVVKGDLQQAASKLSRRSAHKEKMVSSKYGCRKYTLRSSLDGVRVLRSRSSKTTHDTPVNTNTNSVLLSNERREKRKKRKETNRAVKDEFSRIKKRFKYLLNRMTYEQSLIDAYSGEGWKGQSLEKIRPEKELQRAKSEILRCKLQIRDLFQRLYTLCSEGKLQGSLFDSDGQINSEDIFCAKCGSKDLSPDNDIILCDGVCDRGFHQMCLEPPLLNEKIPPGDWLCPGCDCKVDCIDLLNDYQGTNLSIVDSWEKVFPEAAAISSGDRQYDDLGLPSDDSEDNDYDPNGPNHDEKVLKEGSSTKESDFTSASDDSKASTRDEKPGQPSFSSDDSEDNDYDPNGPDPDTDEKVQNEVSGSDESDFTSDSEDLDALIKDNEHSGVDEVPVSSSLGHSEPVTISAEGRLKMDTKEKQLVNSELLSILEPNALLVSRKRHRERLDYKKLHDDAYGNVDSDSGEDEDWSDVPSNSSDDEDWTEMNAQNNVKNNHVGGGNVISSSRNAQTIPSVNQSETPQCKSQQMDGLPELKLNQSGETKNTPQREVQPKMKNEGANYSLLISHSIGNKVGTPGPRSFGKEISQKLCESLKVNIYPTRETKENLSKELGITVQQVSRWFENARRSLRLSAKEKDTANNATILTKNNGKDLESKAETSMKNSTNNESQLNKTDIVDVVVTEHENREGEASKQLAEESDLRKREELKKRKKDMLDQVSEEPIKDGKLIKGMPADSPSAIFIQNNGQSKNPELTPSRIQTRSRKSIT
ncbi:homeodomain-like protein with RING/FYVE/PHD-type zinc finger domain-containing protein [Tasmannia lanceolata]|uniref:homeodomain-like protein with RING/FYVE/PHD-type zinc finger domain-containing protein n=1 Tax=Tasmannia lanceolata TaxID=3420 RepID=UPI004063A459